jgi:transcriptional regulator with XRE-family HTH domain
MRRPTTLDAMAAQLRRVVRASGLTQIEVARRSHTSGKHLGRIVNGQGQASVDVYDAWAQALGYRWEVRLVSNEDQVFTSDAEADTVSPGTES